MQHRGFEDECLSEFWTLTGFRTTNLAISEDTRQLVAGGGSVASSSPLDQPQYVNCGIHYRNLVTGVNDPAILSAATCIWQCSRAEVTRHVLGHPHTAHRHSARCSNHTFCRRLR